MKKTLLNHLKKTHLLALALSLCTITLTACLFDSDENGVESWLDARGLPSSYKVQTLSIENIKVASAQRYAPELPRSADISAVLGHSSNITHDLVFDIAFEAKSNFMKSFTESDTSGAYLGLFWQKPFYEDKAIPSDYVPFDEDVDFTVSWKLTSTDSVSYKKFLSNVMDEADTTWYKSLTEWESDGSVDTTYQVKLTKKMLKAKDTDTTTARGLRLDMPSKLVNELKKVKGAARLQIRLSAPKSPRMYRFYGDGTARPPIFEMHSDSMTYVTPNPFRMADVMTNEEDCPECPILHAGTYDSLVVELPSEPILEALSEFYGDEFPSAEGDGNDVRQVVLHAQLTMARDDSKGSNEFGYPIQMLSGSFVDSADQVVRRMQSKYLIDSITVAESGFQNLIFHDGDSLTIQLTYGVREFLNKASDGRNMKFMMRMGLPYLLEKDPTFTDYTKTRKDTIETDRGDSIVSVTDTLLQYVNYFDYARYDFSTSLENPMTLKLWLASRRGDE